MKVAALLSGGKDSVAAAEVALGHAWDVVAAIIMRPAKDDAWMFHTPNLDAACRVAQCLGLPVHEAACRADPVHEVEDLKTAIQTVANQYALDAIVSGALASEYQRTRIDAICHQIGIRSFAPLWHKEPHAYMQSLLAAGYDIRIVRAAADGLDPSWAGRPLDDAAMGELAKMRLHVAGEGGEYETLVLDAPHFGRRIIVDDAVAVEEGMRATWFVRACHVAQKRDANR